MKNKKTFIYFILVFSIVINILLCVHIAESNSKYKPVYKDEIERDKNMIPNEETAKKVAEVVVESHESFKDDIENMEYETTVTFDEKEYEWIVYYKPKELMFGGGIIVNIRRDNGKIYIYQTL